MTCQGSVIFIIAFFWTTINLLILSRYSCNITWSCDLCRDIHGKRDSYIFIFDIYEIADNFKEIFSDTYKIASNFREIIFDTYIIADNFREIFPDTCNTTNNFREIFVDTCNIAEKNQLHFSWFI